MKIGDEVYIHGFVDEIRKDTVIIRNKVGYFGTDAEEVAPTVERKKGKWRVVSRQADSFTAYRCSECNELVYGRTNFCPNCGADMRGEANE